MNITVEQKQEIEERKSEAEEMLDIARGFAIETQADLDLADQAIRHAKEKWSELEKMRKAITKPIDEAKRGVQALFKPPQTLLKSIEKEFKARISEHVEREEDRNREAIQEGAIEKVTNVHETKGVSTSRHWEFQVTDVDAVPRELCSPDMAKIKTYMTECFNESGEFPNVPGVEAIQQTRIISRAKK